jgi:hypothetical protein
MRYKVLQARERGAVAVIFVAGPAQDEGKEFLPVLKNDGPQSPAGIPVLQVKTSIAQKWGIDLAQFQKDVDADLKPRSRVLPVNIDGRVAAADVRADRDLAGMLPAPGHRQGSRHPRRARPPRLARSMTPNVHAIHNGADDSASGSVAVLLAAQRAADDFRQKNIERLSPYSFPRRSGTSRIVVVRRSSWCRSIMSRWSISIWSERTTTIKVALVPTRLAE